MAKKKSVSAPVPKPYTGNSLGYWAFIVGFVIAILVGVASYFGWGTNQVVTFLLIIAGIIVGFFNVRDYDTQAFLLAGVALVVVGWFGSSTLTEIKLYGEMLNALVTLFVPATMIVALRSLFVLSHR